MSWVLLVVSLFVITPCLGQGGPHPSLQLPEELNRLPEWTQDATIFDSLSTLYQAGTNIVVISEGPVEFNDVTGFYSGRCYTRNNKNKPSNNLLGVVKRLNWLDYQGHPNPPTEKRMTLVAEPQADPDYYDSFADHPEALKPIRNMIKENWRNMTYSVEQLLNAFEDQGTLSVYHRRPGIVYQAKVYERWILVRVALNYTPDEPIQFGEESFRVEAYDPLINCIYFEKVASLHASNAS